MAMNKQRRTSNVNNILTYDTLGNVTIPADLTVEGLQQAGFVKTDSNGLFSIDTTPYISLNSPLTGYVILTATALSATDTVLQAFGKVQASLDAKYDDPTGTTAQYIRGDGTLATFPTIPSGTVTSVGLTMPTAFNVANSPITSSGTLAVTGAGTAAQYIRGDGQLATFPSSAGGGSSVNYYLNGSVNASVGGYKQLDNAAIVGGGTDFTLVGNGLIAQFLTNVGNPNRIQIPGGSWNFEMYFQVSSSGGNQKFYVELHKYDGATFTLIASSSTIPEEITGGTNIDLYLTSLAVPTTALLATDRLAIRVYIVDNSGGRTVTLHTENNTLCEIITTFAGGVASLNGLTANTQYLATGTSGTDFNISSLVDTHTFNLPTASATNRGALSTADWSTFNSKIGGTGVAGQVAYFTGTNAQGGSNNLFWDITNGRLGIGTNAPAVSLDVRNGVNLYTSGAGANVHYLELFSPSNTDGYVNFTRVSAQNGPVAYHLQNGLARFSYNGATGDTILGSYSNVPLLFFTNSTERARITNGGNFIINNPSVDTGQRLQVTGDTLLKGSGATSATSALTVQNSDGTNLLRVRNDLSTSLNFLRVGNSFTTSPFIVPFVSNSGVADAAGTNLSFYTYSTASEGGAVAFAGNPFLQTTGNHLHFNINNSFNPTSGTASFTAQQIRYTINQTGGANGITRGLYVNPTLTAAADWRSIEWTNNTGWGLYGLGTAANYLRGNTGINTTTINDNGLTVNNNANGSNIILSLRNDFGGTDNEVSIKMIAGSTDAGERGTILSHVRQGGGGGDFIIKTNATLSGTPTEKLRVKNNGNVLIGTTTDNGLRFQVTGDGFFSGDTITNGSYRVSTTDYASSLTQSKIEIGSSALNAIDRIFDFGDGTRGWTMLGQQNGGGTTRLYLATRSLNALTNTVVFDLNAPLTGGSILQIPITGVSFAPTSGSSAFNSIIMNPTINQTGGANGVTRGMLIQPTLTAAADWRSIEWTNNTGWGLYGLGTAANYLAGRTSIGILPTTLWSGYTGVLQVGQLWILDYQTGTTGELSSNTYYDGTNSRALRTGGASTISFQSTGAISFLNAASVSAGAIQTVTERMRLDVSGNLGLGTASPTSKLDVIQSGGTAGISVSGGTNPQMRATDGTITAKVQAITGVAAYIGTESNHQLRLITNNSPRLTIDTTGAATFTSSIAAAGNLLLGSSASTIGAMNLILTGTSPVASRLTFGTDGTGYSFAIGKNQGGSVTDLLTILDNGAATFISTITSTQTNGFTIGGLLNAARIQYGSDAATSFSLLTSANAFAGLYASNGVFSSSVTTPSLGVNVSTIRTRSEIAATLAAPTPLNTNVSAGNLLLSDGGNIGMVMGLYDTSFDSYIQARNNSALNNTAYNLLLNPLGGNVIIGSTNNSGEKLQVNGDAKITGKLTLSSSVTTATNGDYSSYFNKTYAQSSTISNINLYGLVSNVLFDLTNAAYSGSATYNATALFAQASIAGNAGTQSTQPIRSIMAALVGKSTSAAMNLSDFRYFDVKSPDDAGVTGHTINSMYGLKIETLKGSSGYTITNGWGVYQEGANDNNYFNGSVGIGSTTLSAKLHVNGDIRTAAPTGGTAVNWKLGSVIVTSGATLLDTRYLEVEVDGVVRKIALIN